MSPTNVKWYRNKKRENWKSNYEHFLGSPKKIADRSERNKARRKLEKEGKVKKWDKKEVHHVNGIAKWNGKSNLRVVSRKTNRVDWAKKSLRAHNKNKNK